MEGEENALNSISSTTINLRGEKRTSAAEMSLSFRANLHVWALCGMWWKVERLPTANNRDVNSFRDRTIARGGERTLEAICQVSFMRTWSIREEH